MLDRFPVTDNLADYYRKRAAEYDTLYTSAAWQSELPVLRDWLAAHVRGRTILEAAAGTGYWTAIAAPVARAIVATDINPEMLAIAAARNLGAHVALVQADCWSLPDLHTAFDVGMAHLWWSHVRKQDRRRFLSQFASHLRRHATVLMIDQNHVHDFGMPTSRRDAAGNSYQTRWLGNGERFEIVKNYPDRSELESCIGEVCEDIDILQLTHFWALRATVGPISS
ncbi:MAG TPA: methyltransferase domain-containing protein [Acetobacteraceae bacterium]|jgi:SAM-dependent methyltransferase